MLTRVSSCAQILKQLGSSKNLVGFLELPAEFFISLYILVTYEKHRKRNLRKTSKKLKFLEVSSYVVKERHKWHHRNPS